MPDIYARFTPESLYTMRRSREMLDAHQSRQMFPEHLLLAILELNRTDCSRILSSLGVNLRQFKKELESSQNEWLAAQDERAGSSVRSYMSRAVRGIIDEAALEAAHDQVFGITTRHLLIGLLATTHGVARRLLSAQGITVDAVRAYHEASIERAGDRPEQMVTGNPFRLSPIFLLVVAVTAGAGYAAYANLTENGIFVFLFVLGGWFISLALHEFGHALAGYYAGDHSVANKGYLTLNPLKYTHWLLSIALPIVFVIMGGIGLPGGAVYIDRSVIRNERLHSLVSAAGPIATLLCTLALAIPFLFHLVSEMAIYTHAEFWGGVAVLLMLEVTALLLNLLPIPGLDGYGIIEPFLSDHVRYTLRPLASVGVFILFFVLFRIEPLNEAFWMAVRGLTDLLQVDGDLIGYGYWLFRFWEM